MPARKSWPLRSSVDDAFAELYPNTPNRELAKRYGRSLITIAKWAGRLGLRKAVTYRRQVQASNAAQRRLTPEQRAYQGDLARGRTQSPETKAKIRAAKIANGTILRGAKHPMWKGGHPWERFADPRYIAWRNAVLARDGYRCQSCGRLCAKHEKGLAAHHVLAYAAHPEARFELANGITLCRACHMSLHGRAPAPVARVPCACGCGTEIDSVDRYGRQRRYVNHHARRFPTLEAEPPSS